MSYGLQQCCLNISYRSSVRCCANTRIRVHLVFIVSFVFCQLGNAPVFVFVCRCGFSAWWGGKGGFRVTAQGIFGLVVRHQGDSPAHCWIKKGQMTLCHSVKRLYLCTYVVQYVADKLNSSRLYPYINSYGGPEGQNTTTSEKTQQYFRSRKKQSW